MKQAAIPVTRSMSAGLTCSFHLTACQGSVLAAGLRYPVPAVRVGIDLWIVLQILGGKVATQEVVQSPDGAFGLADQVLVANREEVGAFQIGSGSPVVLAHLPEQFVPSLTLFEPLGRVPQASRVTHGVD